MTKTVRYICGRIWERVKEEIRIWRVSALPGLFVIALLIITRLLGILQPLELRVFDNFLKFRPVETRDERILIVGINEADILNIGTYPTPDRNLAALLVKLQTYKPSVIGLDLFRDLPIEPGHTELLEELKKNKNVIGIEKVLPDSRNFTINPPAELPSNQVGFADTISDADGYLRRSLLGIVDTKGEYKFSLPLRLAEIYLSRKGLSLENGIHHSDAMRFGNTDLPRFLPNSGGYVGADAGGNQILLNFRNAQKPFRVISLQDVLTGKFSPDWIRNRIILIGATAIRSMDLVNAGAIDNSNHREVYGVEIQAHAVSQIVSAVLDQRPLFKVWADGWEYVWIFAWGLLGISLGQIFLSPLKIFLGLVAASTTLIGTCYVLLIMGWWVPVVPALLALVINGGGLTSSLYRYQKDVKTRIEERQLIIDKIFDAIHNGPLQSINSMLKRIEIEKQQLSSEQLSSMLRHLNSELRGTYDLLRQETITQNRKYLQNNKFYIRNNLELNLDAPIHELLHDVYENTMTRDYSCLKTIKIKVFRFEPINSQSLNIEQKRGLCRFLEEALLNVDKYAVGVTRLEVICEQKQGWNLIRVADNGIGVDSSSSNHPVATGFGTQQSKKLAQQLGGKFQRVPNSPKGTVCELTWRVKRPWFKFLN